MLLIFMLGEMGQRQFCILPMKKIWNLDERNRKITIEPGVTWNELYPVLEEKNLMVCPPMLPPLPAPWPAAAPAPSVDMLFWVAPRPDKLPLG